MEVVAASPSSAGNGTMPPYQRRDVEEWSHLDRLTGMLEHARVETDHWAANTHNSQHKYGKVVDSRDRCAPDGSQQQRQRRQLEVFQAHVPGGSLQVIRTQTVATSSSRWSSASSTQTAAASVQQTNASSLQGFENLQLALNPLDLSSQKTKASVGRSGSIGGRRPPSRPRSLIGRRAEPDAAVSARLQRVSRLCQQLHNETITGGAATTNITNKPSILERQNGDGSVSSDHFENNESPKTSVEHFWNKSNESETNNTINEWKKCSELSRNIAHTSNKTNTDVEADRRLNTALRGNNVDLEALDQILKSISSSTSNYSDKISLSDDFKSDEAEPEKDEELLNASKSKKRHSFITVESLQEVRGRLRRLSSPIDGYKSIEYAKEEEPDDGIADAEETLTKKEETTMPASNTGVSRVRSYVYGMEAMLHNKKPIIGTGSLESRTSSKSNGISTNRSEDWYNRRKSYGFEQVHNQQIDQTNSISLRGKNKIESSTDSGICRSTEIVVVPSVFKPQYNKFNSSSKVELNDDTSRKFNSQQITTSYGKVGNSTVINLNGDNNKTSSVLSNNSDNIYKQQNNELFNVWNRRALFSAEETSNQQNKKDSEQTTITIPIVAEENNDINNRRMYHRQMSDGSSMSIESSWPKNKQSENQEIKRHSIAVDESKYVTNNRYTFNQDKRISLAAGELLPKEEFQYNNDQEEDANTNLNKKQKKVEFCKTEVHFAAESGRVNIVETDEKPPPTQNFRRRRRNSSVTSNHVPENYNKTGLPLIHFGDTTYEKKLFGVSDQEATGTPNEDIYNKDTSFSSLLQENSNNVTVSSVSINQDYEPEREVQENESLPRGILKNKMIKPKPYILGDENNELLAKETTSNEDQDSLIWGVRLKPVHKQEENSQPAPTSTPLWRSTVTVQNTSYNNNNSNNTINKRETVLEDEHEEIPPTSNTQPEFQKLLYSLRPARKSEPSIMTPPETSAPIEKRTTAIDLRRSSWSVADRIKQVEDLKQENKGYSTRVNFGSGETTVVENGDIEKHTTWPRQEELHAKDEKKISSVIKKGLVVRIGRENSNHTVCSKTTTNHNSNSTTTTTKITIDMSSPTNTDNINNYPMFNAIKLPRASLHSLKSTSLIMNTFSSKPEPTIAITPKETTKQTVLKDSVKNLVNGVPDQLAALKRLYEEAAENSDDSHRADEEVRSYMSANGDDSDIFSTEDEVSSVVSGSWSKMRAFKNMKHHLINNIETSRKNEKEIFRNVVNRNTYTKKDISSIKSSFSSNIHKTQNVSSHYDKHRASSDAKITSIREPLVRKHSDSSLTESPKVGRKVNNIKRNFEANRSTYSNGYLSSPSLVDSSVQKPTVKSNKSETTEKKFQSTEERINSFSNKVSSITSKESPNSRRKAFNRKTSPIISQYSYTKQNVPKKLEESKVTNFSGKSNNKQWFDNRPDLLKNHDTKAYVNLSTVIKEENKTTSSSATNKSKIADIRKVSPTKPRPDSPSINRPESPIYENIDEVISNLNAMERESCMLQELTKAADQILQAVNGYTDEDSKVSTDSEDDGKKHRLKLRNTGELSTISETKSWKQVQNKSMKLTSKNVKSRVRATSSTSSIESLTKETKPIPPVRLNRAAKLNEERTKKKITGSNSELSKITKARRLQRASSREALLQSHGSSSEDIAVNTDIRKPRLVRKTKPFGATDDVSRKSSVSQTNSITTTKKKEYDSRRYSDRVPVVGLQEIRHKTAISTIKSTAEKAASREKAMKAKAEELKKRTTGKRDTTSSKGSNTVSSHHGTISTHRSSTTSGQCRGDIGSSGGASGSHSRHQELSGAAVRTSSGVNRKHSRNEGPTKL